MFVASDVAKALGYKDVQGAIVKHCESGDPSNQQVAYLPHPNGVGGTNAILIGEKKPFSVVFCMRISLPDQ